MPKDLKEEPKKKMVVVEEIVEEVEAPVIESEPTIATEPEKKVTENLIVEEEKTNYLWIIIPIALLIGSLVGGFITYFSGISRLTNSNQSPSPIATVIPTAEPTPTASPSANFKRETLKLQVLNGSGVSGLAGKAKTYLESLGYKNVVAGNASISNLIETTISVKESKKDLVENIRTDLEKNYKVAKEIETLVATSKYDFVITLGSK